MGSAEKGVRMEMLLRRWRRRPSLEPELCLGKAAHGASALCRAPPCSAPDALVPFSEVGESTAVLTSFSSVALSEMGSWWAASDLDVLVCF